MKKNLKKQLNKKIAQNDVDADIKISAHSKRKLQDAAYAEALYTFFGEHARMPSYAEFARLCNFKSKDSAYTAIQRLIATGIVLKDASGKLIPKNLPQDLSITAISNIHFESIKNCVIPSPSTYNTALMSDIRVLGVVEAGFPTPAEEQNLDTISLDEWLIPKRESTFMLKVKGESMKDAGIREGDMVIAERAHNAPTGSIVIAEVDGNWTMKYLRKDRQGTYFEPANDDFPIIRPHHSCSIAAVVRGVVRKY
jgi:SOS-response transcriptional repressor LexA